VDGLQLMEKTMGEQEYGQALAIQQTAALHTNVGQQRQNASDRSKNVWQLTGLHAAAPG